MLVFFTADWSLLDRTLDPVIEDVARRSAGQVTVVELDADDPANADFGARHVVTSVPTLLLLANGHVVDRYVGLGTAAAIEHWMSERLLNTRMSNPSFRSQQVLKTSPLLPVTSDTPRNVVSATALRDRLALMPFNRVQRERSVRILFLAANPSDLTRLALTREVEKIGERLQSTSHREIYDLAQHWEVEAAKVPGLILRHRPQIVHFSGHGTLAGELVFQNSSGTSAPSPVEVIASIFGILNKYVRCVVLNACFSQAQAEAIVRSVDVVVGMPAAIPDGDAIAFAAAFYEALGYGEDVKTAFELGCNAIRIHYSASRPGTRDVGLPDDGASQTSREGPVLLTCKGVNPSEVWFVDRG